MTATMTANPVTTALNILKTDGWARGSFLCENPSVAA